LKINLVFVSLLIFCPCHHCTISILYCSLCSLSSAVASSSQTGWTLKLCYLLQEWDKIGWGLISHWFQRKQSRYFMIFWRWVMFREVEGSPCRLRFAQTWPTLDVRIWPSIQKSDQLDTFRVVLLPQNKGYVVQGDTSAVNNCMAYGPTRYYTLRYSSFQHSFTERVSIWHGRHLFASKVPSQRGGEANDVEGMKSHNFVTWQRFCSRGAMERFTGA
jgi:hypothetical protein